MLNIHQLGFVKKSAGIRLIVECGIVGFYDTESSVIEVVSNTVHDEMMKYLVRTTGTIRVYGDAILDQEWQLTRELIADLEKIADLYLHGKIRLGVFLR